MCRSEAIERAMKSDDSVACVYAMVSDPAAVNTLGAPGALQKHYAVVRSLAAIQTQTGVP
jgi:hypothetical protein